MNKFKTLFLTFFACTMVFLTACVTLVPITSTTSAVPQGLALDNVKNSIVEGANERGYMLKEISDNEYEATLILRTHKLVLSITYDTTKYTIAYKSSVGLKATGKKIHSKYNNWTKNLDLSIQQALNKQLNTK